MATFTFVELKNKLLKKKRPTKLQNGDKQAHVLPATQKFPTDAAKLYMQR